MALYRLSVGEILEGLSHRSFSAEELMIELLDRIHRLNSSLHAFVEVNPKALDAARAVDNARSRKETLGPLAGIPIAVKDLADTRDMRTTYGGRHTTRVSTTDATVVKRLKSAGAIIIGKTNLHEYAFGTTTENPHYGVTANPWNRGKISGGSSGGSAVAVAAGLSPAAIGTDTGGSIRIPAALCGIVGLKPTFGLVSTAGVWPLAPTLDHVGPMTKNVEDAGLLMNVMAGYDRLDVHSIRVPVRDYTVARTPNRIRIGVPRHFLWERCHPGVLQTAQAAMNLLQSPRFELLEVDIPEIEDVPEAQSIILSSEALSIHRKWLETSPELYGDDVRSRLESARQWTGGDYVRARAFQRQFAEIMRQVLSTVDVLLCPTTPLTATDIGQTKTHIRVQEVQIRSHLTRLTNPWNLSGLPAITLPCGLAPDGLPTGLQLIGPQFGDQRLLDIARLIQAALPAWPAVQPDFA